ncbi:hypothetical protein IW492_02865 [Enterococcus sp. BWB1-3]|uniref:hypothetical protein n=1 Tax=Enterococcus sp. BWB1-3 TaxID=2787713 RepID=UPI0019226928|nr:hypothetical protein [Enterococcus sp. BWB1-3]MBL1228173.1 hypothetical protein [Enterococcus sp. BWB1-3]
MSVEFNPSIKNVTVANDKVKITLEVDKTAVKQKLGDIAELEGKTITALLRKQSYEYAIPYSKIDNKPGIRYDVDNTGIVQKVVEEQLSLDLENKSDDIENRFFAVEKEIIDEFIMNSPSLEFPGNINPRAALFELENGAAFTEIADQFEMSETAVINELEKARDYYAPYAAAWDEKRQRDGFFATQQEEPADDTKNNDSDNENEGSVTEASETETESDEAVTNDHDGEDPYAEDE